MIELNKHKTIVSNVVVIGCGGAGLREAIEIKNKGLDVCVLGKRPKEDPYTVLAAGGVNAAFGNFTGLESYLFTRSKGDYYDSEMKVWRN